MKVIEKILYFLPVLIIIISCGGNGKSGNIKVDGIQSKVQKVLSGNEIELKNGLKVVILGIKPTEHTKEYLEKQVKGETVTVIADSKQKQFIKSYKTKVKAYVKLKGEKYCISGKLLLNGTADLRQTAVHDSLEHFKTYPNIGDDRPLMSSTELLTFIKPATFMIQCQDGSTGTGFFINENGLALTNNHVLDGTKNAVICFFGDNGSIELSNTRQVNRIIYTEQNQRISPIDYTIFQVQLDNNEKVRYLPIVKHHVKEGENIAKMGCGGETVGSFAANGTLSNYNDGYITAYISINHGDSGGPLVNFKGEVVGIISRLTEDKTMTKYSDGKWQRAEGIIYAVDIDVVKNKLDEKKISYGR